jgi:uncharacterized protein YjiS (DUF1127 family)
MLQCLYNWFSRILTAMQEAQMRRVAHWQLHNMTDRELRDIGISRGQIREVLQGEL